jgi:F-type H+-transporting ATPase subunit delta
MKVSDLARRYSKAIYEIAVAAGNQDKVFDDLRALASAFSKDRETINFFTNPLVPTEARIAAIEKALANKGVSKEALDLVMLLTHKDRLPIFNEIVGGFEAQADSANNVCRGTVRSATALDQVERTRIEQTVEKVLSKKVIMTYKVDPSVIGGLVAQVGSYTFDDSIASHLRRMNEEFKRRTV